ncbi:MAG: EI24 domain-containing protein [Myxococcota bacterium]
MGIRTHLQTTWAEVWRGFSAPFRGLHYMTAHPKTLVYALPPVPIIGALLGGMFYLTYTHSGDLLSWLWAMPEGSTWVVQWLLQPLWHLAWGVVLLLLSAVGLIAVVIVAIPLAGPFMEMLSEKVEAIETGFQAPFNLGVMLRNMAVSLSHALILGGLGLLVTLLSLGLSLIPVAGPVLALVIHLTLTPMLVGFNPFDYPMTIRLWPIGDKMGFVRRNLALVYGFSLCTYLMLYIPLLNLVLLPACVVGATRLLLDLQREGRADFRDRRREVLTAAGHIEDTDTTTPS